MSKQKAAYVEWGKTTVIDFEFFSGASTVFGGISSDSDGWRWCSIQLLPQVEGGGAQYSVAVEQVNSFQMDNVFPGLYVLEAEARLSGGNQSLHYSGEVLVPEEGEVRHDILLLREE